MLMLESDLFPVVGEVEHEHCGMLFLGQGGTLGVLTGSPVSQYGALCPRDC